MCLVVLRCCLITSVVVLCCDESCSKSTSAQNLFCESAFNWCRLQMNQSHPWCVQVPFGEVSAVKNWLNISGMVNKPIPEHPKRPVCGFDCTRSEVLMLQFCVVQLVMLLCGRFILCIASWIMPCKHLVMFYYYYLCCCVHCISTASCMHCFPHRSVIVNCRKTLLMATCCLCGS